MAPSNALLARVLRRHPSVVLVLATLPCAYFAACGVGDVLAARLHAPVAPVRSPPRELARLAATPDHHVRDRRAILHRNVFDSQVGPLDAPAPAPSEGRSRPPPPPASGPPGPCLGQAQAPSPPPCETEARVIGAVMGDDPRWSFALVRARPTEAALPTRAGAKLDAQDVVAVSSCRAVEAWVMLRARSGAQCYLAERMPPRPAPTTTPGGSTPERPVTDVERTGSDAYAVRRDTVDQILANPIAVMRSVRVMPFEENGRAAGVRLLGVTGSPLAAIGLQNGDVLRKINGLELGSPDQMLEAYTRLRTSDRLAVEVTRGGRGLTIDVTVR